jgi:hypothetical protein
MRIRKLPMRFGQGLRALEQELDRVADKHGIEEPLRFMPSPDLLGFEDDKEDDDYYD